MKTRKIVDVKTRLPGPRSSEIIDRWGKVEAKTTGFQAPIAVGRGRGSIIYDADDNKFIDWTSGVLVTNIGHCHPKLVKALHDSTSKMLNCYEYPTEYRVKAAELLVGNSPEHLNTCFFLSTGGEATDAIIRIMKRKSGNFEIIGFHGGFHGRLYAPASVGGISKIKKGFGPSMSGVIRAPFPYCYRCPFKMKKETNYTNTYKTHTKDQNKPKNTKNIQHIKIRKFTEKHTLF